MNRKFWENQRDIVTNTSHLFENTQSVLGKNQNQNKKKIIPIKFIGEKQIPGSPDCFYIEMQSILNHFGKKVSREEIRNAVIEAGLLSRTGGIAGYPSDYVRVFDKLGLETSTEDIENLVYIKSAEEIVRWAIDNDMPVLAIKQEGVSTYIADGEERTEENGHAVTIYGYEYRYKRDVFYAHNPAGQVIVFEFKHFYDNFYNPFYIMQGLR